MPEISPPKAKRLYTQAMSSSEWGKSITPLVHCVGNIGSVAETDKRKFRQMKRNTMIKCIP